METGSSSTGTLDDWWNPYEYAGEHFPDWVIRFDDLHGIPELMCWERKVALIDQTDDKYKRRCSVAHFLGHLNLMHKGSVLDGKEEVAANKWSAGMLIGIHQLADALDWHHYEVNLGLAKDLRVDPWTLQTRLSMAKTHPAERPFLIARRARLEHVA